MTSGRPSPSPPPHLATTTPIWTPGRFVRSNGARIPRARGRRHARRRARASFPRRNASARRSTIPTSRRFRRCPPRPRARPRRPPQSPTTPTLHLGSSSRAPPVPSGSSPVPAKKPLASARTLASTPRPFPSRARRRDDSDVSATDDAFAHRDTPVPRRRRRPGRRLRFTFRWLTSRRRASRLSRSVREHFPDAPLYVSSDDGWDCASMCEQYLCDFTLHDPPPGYALGRRRRVARSTLDPRRSVRAPSGSCCSKTTCAWTGPSPDGQPRTRGAWRITGGPRPCPRVCWRRSRDEAASRPRARVHGLCGGAIVSVDALTSVDPEDAKEEVEVMRALDDRVGKWNDVTLAALLMARGKSVAPWADLKQGNHPPPETALTHDDKRFYGKRMAEDERGMCAPPRTKEG